MTKLKSFHTTSIYRTCPLISDNISLNFRIFPWAHWRYQNKTPIHGTHTMPGQPAPWGSVPANDELPHQKNSHMHTVSKHWDGPRRPGSTEHFLNNALSSSELYYHLQTHVKTSRSISLVPHSYSFVNKNNFNPKSSFT